MPYVRVSCPLLYEKVGRVMATYVSVDDQM